MKTVNHAWAMQSQVVRIEGTGVTGGETVVLGEHIYTGYISSAHIFICVVYILIAVVFNLV